MFIRDVLQHASEKITEIWLVASWDVVRQARRPTFTISRFMIALIISVQFIWLWGAEFGVSSASEYAPDISPAFVISKIRSIYTGSMVFIGLGVIVFCPLLTVGCVAGDRERKIWYDIVNSPLSGWTILMGKMIGRLATVFSWIIAVLPVWAILGLVGGLDPLIVLCGFILILSYGWFYAAIGLFASTVTTRTRDAMALSTAMIAAIVFLPVMMMLIFEEIMRVRSYRWIWQPCFALNPLFASEFLKTFDRNTGMMLFIHRWLLFGLLASLGPILTAFSGLILRPVSRRLERSGARNEKQSTNKKEIVRTADAFLKSDYSTGLSALWYSPMAIKERKIRSGSRLVRVFVKLVAFLILILSSYFVVYFGSRAFSEMMTFGLASANDSRRQEFGVFLMIASGLAHFSITLAISIDMAGRLVSEKESDAWLTLISTPFEAREIYIGKAIGAVWTWRWLFVYILISWMIGMVSGAINPIACFLAVIVWSVHIGLALAIGISIGAKSKNYQAMLFKITIIWGFIQILIPTFFAGTFTSSALGMSPSFMAGATFEFLDSRWNSRDERMIMLIGLIQFILACVVSAFLTGRAIQRFDVWNDRIVGNDE